MQRMCNILGERYSTNSVRVSTALGYTGQLFGDRVHSPDTNCVVL